MTGRVTMIERSKRLVSGHLSLDFEHTIMGLHPAGQQDGQKMDFDGNSQMKNGP